MNSKLVMLVFILTFHVLPVTQGSLFGQGVLQSYIDQGLGNNLVMKEKNISLQQSLLALKEARSWFYPSADFLGDYTWAEGGRSITFPVGDLLNPVYSTLNQLTGTQKFPQIPNAEFQLMPTNFYDARVRIAYPLVNTDLAYNYKIKKQEVILANYEIETYKQELIKDIQTSYYRYCLATDASAIYQSALGLVNKNLEVNRSLLRNGKGLPANVLRAESEAEVIGSRLREAEDQRKNARSWFNFLLNRQPADSVVYETLPMPEDLAMAVSETPDIAGRSELRELATASTIRQTELSMHRSYAVPKVNTFVDLGSQSSDWQFNDHSRYFLAGLQMTVPIFNGLRNRVKISKNKLEIDMLAVQTENAGKQFTVSALVARNNLGTAVSNLSSSEKQYQSARAYFSLIEKAYSEGMNSLIEFMDARNQYTASEIQVRLNRYKVLSAYAELKRQTSISTIQ
ncbi:MAG: TolC family protein [Bacteroidales bacterium]